MANGRFAQQISAIVTRCLLLRSARQKRMMWARPRSRMLFCNVVSGWEDAEWKRNFRIGRPTTSLCFFFRAFIFSRHCVNVRLYPDFSSSSEIFRYDTSFSSFHVAPPVFPPRSTTPVVNSSSFAVSLSQVCPLSAIFNPLFALKPVSNPSPDEGRTRMLNPGSTQLFSVM